MPPAAHLKARQRYASANALYHQGHYDAALAAFRTVLEVDPDHAPARAKIAGLLRVTGKHLGRSGEVEIALGCLREAWSIDPTTRRLRAVYLEILQKATAEEIARGEVARARALLKEALGVDPAGPESLHLLDALGRLPSEPFEQWSDTAVAGRGDLVVLEAGVDEVLAGGYLRFLAGAEVYAQRSLALGDLVYTGGIRARPLHGLGSVGLPEEVALAGEANRIGLDVLGQLRRCLPQESQHVGGLDVLELLSFELDALVFAHAKTLSYLTKLLGSNRFRRVIFLLGDGTLARAAATPARAAVGAENVQAIWCSRTLRRYGARCGPLDEQQIRRTVAEGAVELVPSSNHLNAAEDRRSARSWRLRVRQLRLRTRLRRAWLRFRARARELIVRRPAGGVAILPSPSALHGALLRPVVQRLTADVPVCIVDIALRRSQRRHYRSYLDVSDRHPVWIERRLSPSTRLTANEGDADHASAALEALDHMEELEALTIDGARLWPLLAPALLRFLSRRMPVTRRFAEDFERFVRDQRPQCIVVGRDRQGLVRAALEIARRRGIPTVTTQPYLVSSHPMWNALQADYVTVVDDFASSVYREHLGAREDQVIMTGIPRFDRIVEQREELRARADEHDRQQGRERSVLLILQRFSSAYTDGLISEVAKAVAAIEDVQLIVKMHPSESVAQQHHYERLTAQLGLGQRSVVHASGDLAHLMVDVDVVVAVWSTAIIEAAMLDRLVLRLNLRGDPMPVPFVEMGLAVGADSPEELRRVLRDCLEDETFKQEAARRRRAYLARNPHLLERPAADHIADAVLRLAAKRGGAECDQLLIASA